jgi:GNAT superfamily N-acetyltransferase
LTTKYAIRYTSTLGAPALTDQCDAQFNPAPVVQVTTDVVFYSWWRSDPCANLTHLPGFDVEIAEDYRLVAELARLDLAEILARVRGGHRPYIACLSGVPVAYGWSAVNRASIGELGLEFAIPAGNRYLWDFATLPAWRGMGIYPHLLQAILSRESIEADRFWIGHVYGNSASGRGIVKAGFGEAGATGCRNGRALTFTTTGPAARARACAGLLGLGMTLSRSVRSV